MSQNEQKNLILSSTVALSRKWDGDIELVDEASLHTCMWWPHFLSWIELCVLVGSTGTGRKQPKREKSQKDCLSPSEGRWMREGLLFFFFSTLSCFFKVRSEQVQFRCGTDHRGRRQLLSTTSVVHSYYTTLLLRTVVRTLHYTALHHAYVRIPYWAAGKDRRALFYHASKDC